jgi:hypothetical protein
MSRSRASLLYFSCSCRWQSSGAGRWSRRAHSISGSRCLDRSESASDSALLRSPVAGVWVCRAAEPVPKVCRVVPGVQLISVVAHPDYPGCTDARLENAPESPGGVWCTDRVAKVIAHRELLLKSQDLAGTRSTLVACVGELRLQTPSRSGVVEGTWVFTRDHIDSPPRVL